MNRLLLISGIRAKHYLSPGVPFNDQAATSQLEMERIVSVLFLGISIAYLVGSLSFPIGGTGKPGPGLVPRTIGLFLLAVGICNFVQTFFSSAKKPSQKEEIFTEMGENVRVIGIALSLVLYLFLLSALGYLLATVLLMAVTLYLLGMRKITSLILFSISLSIASYGLFSVALDVPLPKGLFLF